MHCAATGPAQPCARQAPTGRHLRGALGPAGQQPQTPATATPRSEPRKDVALTGHDNLREARLPGHRSGPVHQMGKLLSDLVDISRE